MTGQGRSLWCQILTWVCVCLAQTLHWFIRCSFRLIKFSKRSILQINLKLFTDTAAAEPALLSSAFCPGLKYGCSSSLLHPWSGSWSHHCYRQYNFHLMHLKSSTACTWGVSGPLVRVIRLRVHTWGLSYYCVKGLVAVVEGNTII